jgi:zinc transport system substrate-binding protein
MNRLLTLFVSLFTLNVTAQDKLTVAAANYPLAYFAQRIGADSIKIVYPIPADEDPAFWEPKDADIAAFQAADVILMNGATYSKWADKVTLSRAKTTDTSASFKGSYIEIKEAATHAHGPGAAHSHAGIAFTTWLDMQQAIAQANAIRKALLMRRPQAFAEFEKNFTSLKADLESLDTRLLAAGKALANRPLAASHPVYHYLARRYALNLQSVLWEPDLKPTAEQLSDLKALLGKHPSTLMLWEGDPIPEAAAAIQTLGLSSHVFDPCGNTPETGDWLSVMQANTVALEQLAKP